MKNQNLVFLSAVCLCFFFIFNHPAKTAVFPDTDWQTKKKKKCGLDSVKLQKAVQYLEQEAGRDGVKELFIVRDGYVIWQGDNVDKIHGVWSLTKSFTSTMLGLLVDAKNAKLLIWHTSFSPRLNNIIRR